MAIAGISRAIGRSILLAYHVTLIRIGPLLSTYLLITLSVNINIGSLDSVFSIPCVVVLTERVCTLLPHSQRKLLCNPYRSLCCIVPRS